jgi:hypothetical protein
MYFFCLSSNTDKTFTVLDYMSNWAGVLLYETGTAYPSLAPGFTASFFGGTVLLIFLFFNVLWFLLKVLSVFEERQKKYIKGQRSIVIPEIDIW